MQESNNFLKTILMASVIFNKEDIFAVECMYFFCVSKTIFLVTLEDKDYIFSLLAVFSADYKELILLKIFLYFNRLFISFCGI